MPYLRLFEGNLWLIMYKSFKNFYNVILKIYSFLLILLAEVLAYCDYYILPGSRVFHTYFCSCDIKMILKILYLNITKIIQYADLTHQSHLPV